MVAARPITAALLVEARAGALARVGGHAPARGEQGHLDMLRWKQIVKDSVARDRSAPLAVAFFGEANLVTGYRLYYLLRFAKRAGIASLTLVSDGRFWIDEATDWLVDCGIDRIAVIAESPDLSRRIEELEAVKARTGTLTPEVVTTAPGSVEAQHIIDWHGVDITSRQL